MLRSRAKPSFFLPNRPKKVRAPSVSFWEMLPEPRLHTPAQGMVGGLFPRVSGAPSHVLRLSGTPGLRAGGRCLCGDNPEARGPGGAGRMRASSDAVCSRGARFPLGGGTWDPKPPSLVPAHQRSHSSRLQERRALHP